MDPKFKEALKQKQQQSFQEQNTAAEAAAAAAASGRSGSFDASMAPRGMSPDVNQLVSPTPRSEEDHTPEQSDMEEDAPDEWHTPLPPDPEEALLKFLEVAQEEEGGSGMFAAGAATVHPRGKAGPTASGKSGMMPKPKSIQGWVDHTATSVGSPKGLTSPPGPVRISTPPFAGNPHRALPPITPERGERR